MGGLADIVASAVSDARFRAVRAVLPVEHWVIVPGRFRFGVPWPWQPTDDHGDIVDATGEVATTRPLAAAFAPRTDGAATFVVWRDDRPATLDASGALARGVAAALYNGRERGVRRIRLAGSRAVVVAVEIPGEGWVHRLTAEWSTTLLQGELRVPSAGAAGYLPHLDTMLASWSWR